jgi:RNA-directed DNA polymerase
MTKRKAPKIKPPPDPESEAWNTIPWRKLEQHCFRIQKRIFRASQRGKTRAVHKRQKLLMKSQSARLLAVRRVTQENQGKKTAGIDGVKSVKPVERSVMASQIHPKNWKDTSPPVRRVWIPKPGKTEKRPLGIPVMVERARQHLAKLALEPEWEARFEPNSYGFREGTLLSRRDRSDLQCDQAKGEICPGRRSQRRLRSHRPPQAASQAQDLSSHEAYHSSVAQSRGYR